MIRLPPRSTRTDTLFPYTTLFRSELAELREDNSNSSTGLNPRRPCCARIVAGDCFASGRSEEHTSELQSLMRISYAVFCLKKKKLPEHKKLPRRLHSQLILTSMLIMKQI